MTLNPNWLAAFVAIPLLGGGLGLLITARDLRVQLTLQRVVAGITVIINLLLALWLLNATVVAEQRLVLQMGLWQAPFGITLVADGLSAIMLTLTALLTTATVLYAIGTLDEREGMNFHPLLLFLLMGVNGAFLAGDLFNLYVFFEVLLMASFVLLTLGGRPSQVNGGVRYVVLNLLASMIFLVTAGVTYGTLGTLNFAHLAERLSAAPPVLRMVLGGMLLITYGSKAGLFPFFFWLPASYHTPHPAVTAIFGGLLTKVGIYTLFRIYPLLFPDLLVNWQPLILTIAGLSMVTGVFGALSMNTIRRGLSFLVISHVGFITMGFGLATVSNQLPLGFGLAAAIFYMVHHMIVKTALLMAGGAAEITMGTGQLRAGHLGGLIKQRPLLATIFFLAAFSLAGFPPFSGFVSKLGLLQIALDNHQWLIAAVSLVVSLFTLMAVVRFWQLGFAGTATAAATPTSADHRQDWLALTPIAALVALSLWIGLFSGPIFQWSSVAATQVLDRAGYIQAVNPTSTIEMVETPHE